MTPLDVLAYTIAAVGCLYAAYRIVMWIADRVIDGISELTQFE
jgi:hypothetical protein